MNKKLIEEHLMSSLDYAAGFFDGDGSIFSVYHKRRLLWGLPIYSKVATWCLRFTNTDRRVLEAVKSILEIRNNVLHVQIRKPRLPHHNLKLPIYDLRVMAHSEVLRVAKLLVDRCIVKRSRLQDAINDLEKRERTGGHE